MATGDGHFEDASFDKLHIRIANATEGGACLTGHQASFANFNGKATCNYRYQAYEQAQAKSEIEARLHSYSTRKRKNVSTSAPGGGAHGNYPSHYCASLTPPRARDWHIGGPVKDIVRGSFAGAPVTVTATKNFTQDTWPYWNNAHHLIPKGTLKNRIRQEEAKVAQLVQKCLLKAEYNINHKVNMLLLPQDREVANILNIPRHLQLTHKDGRVKVAVGNHPVYNKMVAEIKKGLNNIIKKYAANVKGAITKAKKQGHAVPNVSLDKKKLEDLSETLLDMILDWSGPKSLDAHAKAKMGG